MPGYVLNLVLGLATPTIILGIVKQAQKRQAVPNSHPVGEPIGNQALDRCAPQGPPLGVAAARVRGSARVPHPMHSPEPARVRGSAGAPPRTQACRGRSPAARLVAEVRLRKRD